MATLDRAGIADRLRALLAIENEGDLEQTASRLGIEEFSLRMSIDELSPSPTVELLAAVVRGYGVDPSWLLTGTYEASTHRTAMEGTDLVGALRALMGTSPARIAQLRIERDQLHDRS